MIGPYKPAIFYAAGTVAVSTVFALLARLKMDRSFASEDLGLISKNHGNCCYLK